MADEPFGRQPKPVTVTITGESDDVRDWMTHFVRSGEFKGDNVEPSRGAIQAGQNLTMSFRIFPRAVND